MFPKFNLVHPARLFALVEAVIAAVAAFLPMTGTQVAALCAVAALITGEGVKRRVSTS
jgi:hypothetical protein